MPLVLPLLRAGNLLRPRDPPSMETGVDAWLFDQSQKAFAKSPTIERAWDHYWQDDKAAFIKDVRGMGKAFVKGTALGTAGGMAFGMSVGAYMASGAARFAGKQLLIGTINALTPGDQPGLF